MCKMTAVDSQPFLHELQKMKFKFLIGKNNKLYIERKLPSEVAEKLPRELIPSPVLHLLKQYEEGSLKKDVLGAPKYHDRIMRLRRYGLIPPVPRISPAEKRAQSREYLRQWRKKKSVTAM